VDFPGDTVPIWGGRAGEVSLRAKLFVAVMGASSWLYAEASQGPGRPQGRPE
jgi:transposase